jgi:toxin FitB
MSTREWTVAEAKAKFSEIDRASANAWSANDYPAWPCHRSSHIPGGMAEKGQTEGQSRRVLCRISAARVRSPHRARERSRSRLGSMTFLLDTNAMSEWVKPRPNVGLVAWLAEIEEDAASLSVVTLAELRNGFSSLAASRRRERLDRWLTHELPGRFEGRILPTEAAIADQWGRLTAAAKAVAYPCHGRVPSRDGAGA